MANDPEFLSAGHACRVLDISVRTLDKYIASGLVEAYKLPSGHWRIRRVSLLTLLSPPKTPAKSHRPST